VEDVVSRPVLLRAKSGPTTGMGHTMRSRSVAQELLAQGGRPVLIVDDVETARALASEPFEVVTVDARPDWASEPAAAAMLDGFVDWSPELEALRASGTPAFLVENRTPARELADRLVYPALHYEPDAWDEAHAERVLAGPGWIPLAREVRGVRPVCGRDRRDVDLLVTFGGSDPFELTERVLAALDPAGRRVVVAVGPHMAQRRAELARLAAESGPEVRVLLPGMPLARWIARSRAAITAVGTTLYELAYLGVGSLVVANHEGDRQALSWYEHHGPHLPLGLARELSHEGLRAALRSGLAELSQRPEPNVPELGEGATRLAQSLLSAA
jgi:spore coat polysaccharide biosynthesis predicted glycosyltransferase SpsG